MHKYLIYAILILTPKAFSANPALNQADLANAQMRYQALVSAQSNDQSALTKLQERLYNAEQRLVAAQLEVNRIRAEILIMQDIHQKNASELKNAGDHLDKAWNAVYGR